MSSGGALAAVGGEVLADLLDSRRGLRTLMVWVGVPGLAIAAWVFERLIFGRRRRYPIIGRRRSARLADRAWRDRADAVLRAEAKARDRADTDGA